MIERVDRGGIVVFKKGKEEIIGLYRDESNMGNAVYQKWWGDVKVLHIVADLDDISEWINRESLTDDEFEELKRLIEDNAVFW